MCRAIADNGLSSFFECPEISGSCGLLMLTAKGQGCISDMLNTFLMGGCFGLPGVEALLAKEFRFDSRAFV